MVFIYETGHEFIAVQVTSFNINEERIYIRTIDGHSEIFKREEIKAYRLLFGNGEIHY